MYDTQTLDNTTWDEVAELWEEFQHAAEHQPPVNLKRQALSFLRKKMRRKLTRSDLRRLSAKINKIKNSENLQQRARSTKLYKDLVAVFNC
jgi:5-methylcytosine-specific restriction endonuclease McrBC regulatory subunit McrC